MSTPSTFEKISDRAEATAVDVLTDHVLGNVAGVTRRIPLDVLQDLWGEAAQVITGANGTALRFPEVGVQVCWGLVTIDDWVSATTLTGVWSFPAAFSSAPLGVLGSYDRNSIAAGTTSGASSATAHGYNVSTLTTAEVQYFVNFDLGDPVTDGDEMDVFLVAIGEYSA